MDGIVLFALIVAGLAFVGALSLSFGVDSRPGFGEGEPVQPVTSLLSRGPRSGAAGPVTRISLAGGTPSQRQPQSARGPQATG